jgi:hypothetical protein
MKNFPSLNTLRYSQEATSARKGCWINEEDAEKFLLDKRFVRTVFESVRKEEGVELNCGGVLDEILTGLGL